MANIVRQAGDDTDLLVIAPFLSPRTRELLTEHGASYADASGNLRITANRPAMFLMDRGADSDPDRRPRALQSLKGAAAGRVVRALCDFLPPYGVRQLAQASSTPLATVSRVVSFLDEEALLKRDEDRSVAYVDWASLVNRWAEDYSVRTSNRVAAYLDPRGLSMLPAKLSRLDRYAVTGSMAGPAIAPTRLAMVYVGDTEKAAHALDLVPVEAGANVWLLEPYDQVVFERTRELRLANPTGSDVSVVAAAASQVAVDLMTSPGRGPQEAEALIEELRGAERAWRISL